MRPAEGFCLTSVALLAGNAWTHTAADNRGSVDFWWSHGALQSPAELCYSRSRTQQPSMQLDLSALRCLWPVIRG